jgi:hypothetical protein
MNFTPINERLSILRVKDRFLNYSFINIHALSNDSDDEAKYLFYEELERCTAPVREAVMGGDANAKIGQTKIHHATIDK